MTCFLVDYWWSIWTLLFFFLVVEVKLPLHVPNNLRMASSFIFLLLHFQIVSILKPVSFSPTNIEFQVLKGNLFLSFHFNINKSSIRVKWMLTLKESINDYSRDRMSLRMSKRKSCTEFAFDSIVTVFFPIMKPICRLLNTMCFTQYTAMYM